MRDPRDYKLELRSAAAASGTARDGAVGEGNRGRSRPFLCVHFACCGAYQRIYRNESGIEYTGRCPRCGKAVRFVVGPGGTSERFFVVE